MTTTLELNSARMFQIAVDIESDAPTASPPLMKYLQDWFDKNVQGEWTEEWAGTDNNIINAQVKLYHFEDPNDAALFKLTFL